MAVELKSEDFQSSVLDAGTPSVVDFGAVWCGPCRMLEPSMKKLAEDYKDKAGVFKMDVDKAREIATKFGVRSVPTIIFFKGGKEVDRIVGLVPYDHLTKKLDTLIG